MIGMMAARQYSAVSLFGIVQRCKFGFANAENANERNLQELCPCSRCPAYCSYRLRRSTDRLIPAACSRVTSRRRPAAQNSYSDAHEESNFISKSIELCVIVYSYYYLHKVNIYSICKTVCYRKNMRITFRQKFSSVICHLRCRK